MLLTDTLLGSSSTTLYQVGRVVRVGGPVQGLNGFLVVLVMIRYMHLSKWLFNTGLILEYFIKCYRTKNFRIEVLFFFLLARTCWYICTSLWCFPIIQIFWTWSNCNNVDYTMLSLKYVQQINIVEHKSWNLVL